MMWSFKWLLLLTYFVLTTSFGPSGPIEIPDQHPMSPVGPNPQWNNPAERAKEMEEWKQENDKSWDDFKKTESKVETTATWVIVVAIVVPLVILICIGVGVGLAIYCAMKNKRNGGGGVIISQPPPPPPPPQPAGPGGFTLNANVVV
uniref:Uncharacterized protein n=1 Tax=Panagrolaimus sp. PS1159 TaxID=55785 RepID=A0AC35FIM8_9BILA